MFLTVRLSIIRSLFTVHSVMVYVIQLLSRTRMKLVLLKSCLQTCMTYTIVEYTVNKLFFHTLWQTSFKTVITVGVNNNTLFIVTNSPITEAYWFLYVCCHYTEMLHVTSLMGKIFWYWTPIYHILTQGQDCSHCGSFIHQNVQTSSEAYNG